MKKKKIIAALLLSFTFLCSVTVTSASAETTTDAQGMETLGTLLWSYNGNETTITIPENVTSLRNGAFNNSPVQTVIIPHRVDMRYNVFSNAYHLTDIYLYSKDVQHIYSIYEGTLCKHGELACIDKECNLLEKGIFATFLSDIDTHADKYVSKTLTIHGYKGSTAERFVQLVNDNPHLFNSPQTLVFEPIEEDAPAENDTENTPQDPGASDEGSAEPPTNNDVNKDNEDKKEEADKPVQVPEVKVHFKGSKGTGLHISSLNGITYPRYVTMKAGSYYIVELGNLPEGYSYSVPKMNYEKYTLNPETGEFKGLQQSSVSFKINLKYPDGRYANLPCTIYIKGE